MNRSDLKNSAKKAITGKIGILLAIYIVAAIIMMAIGSLTYCVGGILIAGGYMLSISTIYLSIVNKNKKPAVEDLLIGFKNGNFTRGLLGYIRYEIFVFLWSLLLVVPGIIKALAYSQMFFLLADNPKLSAAEAQKKSISMMDGRKGELFVLYLSFIPWLLLVGISFGLAAIYVAPYMKATLAEYYNSLKKADKVKK